MTSEQSPSSPLREEKKTSPSPFAGEGRGEGHQSPVTSHGRVVNALTVDVEDYFHVSAFANTVKLEDWDKYESRIERNTNRLLEIFNDYDCKGTFFVLGWVARRYPTLIREIANRGHEVACHGYGHALVYDQTPEKFREDTLCAKALLEDVVGRPVHGYRAASFSITKRSTWALDIVAEAGFIYDSSIFPIHHDRYGMSGAHRHPHRLETPRGASIVEFPLSTVKFLNWHLPVSGGGYFRLFPYWLTKRSLARINLSDEQPFIFYLHPWEIDPEQPRIYSGWISRFRHYNNLDKCERRVGRLLADFQFGTVREVLQELRLFR